MKKFVSAFILFVSMAIISVPAVSAFDNVATGSDARWKTVVPIVAVVVAIIILVISLTAKKKD